MLLSEKRITTALIRLRGCTGWSVPLLFPNLRRQVFLRRGPYIEAPPSFTSDLGILLINGHNHFKASYFEWIIIMAQKAVHMQHQAWFSMPCVSKYWKYTMFVLGLVKIICNIVPLGLNMIYISFDWIIDWIRSVKNSCVFFLFPDFLLYFCAD